MHPLSGRVGPGRGRRFPGLVGTVALPVLLAGCQGTGFGEGLSRSFSSPPPSPEQGVTAGSPRPPAADAPAAEGKDEQRARQEKPRQESPEPREEKPVRPEQAAPAATPSPYRLILRLPLADPAAPAEVVTRALRAAGVPFEVETIERMSPPAAEAEAGATPSEPTAKPSSRPAPEPSR